MLRDRQHTRDGEHRHRRLSRRTGADAHGAAQERGHRDVSREGAGQEQLPVLFAGDEHASRRARELETALRRALERGELMLYLPAAGERARGPRDAASRRWCAGCIRTQGIMNPPEFMPIAEDAGLFARSATGCCARRARSCAPGRPQGRRGPAHRGQSLDAPVRPGQSDRAAARGGARRAASSRAQLELEITESMLMRHAERAAKLLAQLKEIGRARRRRRFRHRLFVARLPQALSRSTPSRSTARSSLQLPERPRRVRRSRARSSRMAHSLEPRRSSPKASRRASSGISCASTAATRCRAITICAPVAGRDASRRCSSSSRRAVRVANVQPLQAVARTAPRGRGLRRRAGARAAILC